jgi:hypothetical protein
LRNFAIKLIELIQMKVLKYKEIYFSHPLKITMSDNLLFTPWNYQNNFLHSRMWALFALYFTDDNFIWLKSNNCAPTNENTIKKKRVRIVGQNMLNQKMFGQKNNCWETQNKAQQEMFGQYCVQKMKNVRKIIAKETNLA